MKLAGKDQSDFKRIRSMFDIEILIALRVPSF